MTYNYVKIPNTNESRRPPPGKYRLLWTGRTEELPGLYHLEDFDNAQVAIDAAKALGFRGGNGIVETNQGWILTLSDGGAQMYTPEKLLSTFGRQHERSSKPLTSAHVDAIIAEQANRLPGCRPGDQILVFWDDIEKATGARAHPGDF